MKTILNYFQNKNIVINGCLRKDLEKRNWMALSYISYTIKNLVGIKGIEELLKEIAHLDFKTRNGRRIYHNSLQQFHAIYFVRNQLRYKILEVESRNHKIFSPYGDNIKSCDIKAQKNGKVYYFESKDSSSIILASNDDLPKYTTFEEETAKWVSEKSKEADKKGANYLICRPELWLDFGLSEKAQEEKFYKDWVNELCQKHFQIRKKLSQKELRVISSKSYSLHFKGIYILKRIGYIKLSIVNNRQRN